MIYDSTAMGTAPSSPLLVTLHTANYILRPLTAADATEHYASWVNDPEVNHFTQVRYSRQTPETLARFIASHDNINRLLWGIFPAQSPARHVGNHTLEIAWRHRTAMLGIMVGDKEFWGGISPRKPALDFWISPSMSSSCTRFAAAAYP